MRAHERVDRMKRSLFVVVAGCAVWALAKTATFTAVAAWLPDALPQPDEDVFPSTVSLLAMLGSDVLFMIVAGYVTAAVARRVQVGHAAALGAAIVVLGLALMMVGWRGEPLWYQVTLVAIAVPAAVTGGSLRSQRRDAAPR
jgi:hypothetical protein